MIIIIIIIIIIITIIIITITIISYRLSRMENIIFSKNNHEPISTLKSSYITFDFYTKI